MTEERKKLWLNYLALTTVILAVCATLSAFKKVAMQRSFL